MKASIWVIVGVVGIVALAAGGLAASGRAPLRYAATGTGYVAHVVCSCRYVANRNMASCLTDYEPGMEIVSVSDDAKAKRITAWVPLLSKRTASYDPRYGCMLDER